MNTSLCPKCFVPHRLVLICSLKPIKTKLVDVVTTTPKVDAPSIDNTFDHLDYFLVLESWSGTINGPITVLMLYYEQQTMFTTCSYILYYFLLLCLLNFRSIRWGLYNYVLLNTHF